MPGSAADDTPLTRRSLLGGLGTGLAAATTGCLARGEDSGLDGEIRIDGSDTVLPHSAAIAEEFQWRNNRVRIPVRGSGTGAGFQKFCRGETDVQNASREITDDEEELCSANGIDYFPLEVALDGIAVFVNPENDWCDCLTVDQLNDLWDTGSSVDRWSDLDDDWPDEEIQLYGRDSGSGTFDYFTEAINGEAGRIRTDYFASADTNVIVRGVRGNEYAIGFGGAGYYYENEDDLKLVGVDDGDGCVKPTRESVESRTYTPLARPLFTYLRPDRLEREEYRAFARFYFEEVDDEYADEAVTWTQWAAREVGYYAVPDETVDEYRERLEDAIEEWS